MESPSRKRSRASRLETVSSDENDTSSDALLSHSSGSWSASIAVTSANHSSSARNRIGSDGQVVARKRSSTVPSSFDKTDVDNVPLPARAISLPTIDASVEWADLDSVRRTQETWSRRSLEDR